MEPRVGWMGFLFWPVCPRVYADHNVNNVKNEDVLTAGRRVLATVSTDTEKRRKET